MEKKMETTKLQGLYRGSIGMMEKKTEATVQLVGLAWLWW